MNELPNNPDQPQANVPAPSLHKPEGVQGGAAAGGVPPGGMPPPGGTPPAGGVPPAGGGAVLPRMGEPGGPALFDRLARPLPLAVIALAVLLALQTYSSHNRINALRQDMARSLQKGNAVNAETDRKSVV